jgi:hypothetical protein
MSIPLEIQETPPGKNVRWTYAGALDDMVQSYPWAKIEMTKKKLDVHLAYAVVTGTPILINDGYLILNSACFESLRRADSPLRVLINKRYIRVLSRNSERSLVQVVKDGAGQEITTYKKLLQNSKRWNSVQRILDDFQSDLSSKDSFVGWPQKDLTGSYLELVRYLAGIPHRNRGLDGVPEKVFNEIVESFDHEMSVAPGKPRTKLEDLILKKANSKAQQRSLMQMANEIYHHNFGIALTASPPSGFSDVEVAVQTRLSNAFLSLYKSHTPRIRQISTAPLQVHMPANLDYANGNLLIPLFDIEQPLGKTRSDYFALRARYLAGERDESEMTDMTNQYQHRLDEYWHSVGRHSMIGTRVTNIAVGAAATLLGAAGIVTAPIPTLLLGAVVIFATEFGNPTLMEKWELPHKLHIDKIRAKLKPRSWQRAVAQRSALIALTVNPNVAQTLMGTSPKTS